MADRAVELKGTSSNLKYLQQHLVGGRQRKRRPRAKAGDSRHRATKRAARHNRRAAQARMIDPSIEALVVASRKRPDLVGPILMSSFSRRRERVAEDQTLLPMRAWYELAKVPLADHLLSRMGAPWPPAKDIILSVDWVSSMRWGLDHFTYSARLLRSDLTVGGVLSVRMLIERWTLNVAHHHKIHRRSDEADSDFITRA